MPELIKVPLVGAAVLGGIALFLAFIYNLWNAIVNVWWSLPSSPVEYVCLGLGAIILLYIVGAVALDTK